MSVRCWKCGSKNVTVTLINQQSYSVGKGVAGTLLFGAAGAAMGINGKSNEKKKYVCQACGESSTSCMSQSMCEHIETEIADNSFLLPSLKKSYPNIEWEPTQSNKRAEKYKESEEVHAKNFFSSTTTDVEDQSTVEIDIESFFDDVLCRMHYFYWSLDELRMKVAEEMGIDEAKISFSMLERKLSEVTEHFGTVFAPFRAKNKKYYATDISAAYKLEGITEYDVEIGRDLSDGTDYSLMLCACEALLDQGTDLLKDDREEITNYYNRLKELVELKKASDEVRELIEKNTCSAYEKAIEILKTILIPNQWGGSEKLLLWCQQGIEEIKEEEKKAEERRLIAARKLQGVCLYCGGAFKGFFTTVCSKCGRRKDY